MVSPLRERNFEERRRGGFVAFLRRITPGASMSMLAALSALGACAPKLNAGAWQCPGGGAAGAPAKTDPVAVPWSTDFEDGFCAYPSVEGPGYCYGDDPYLLVTEPHRPVGHFAAEFKVVGGDWDQTRCVRQGAFPESAFYGAWYFIPEALQKAENWNLWHFQGDPRPPFWDVTLSEIADSGTWELVVRDYVNPAPGSDYTTYDGTGHKPVPIGKWFHIELFLKRVSDSTGKIALYQDSVLLFERANLKSDASPFTQWYVGDWAKDAIPANSSLYVDDVSISATLSATSATP